MLSLEGKTYNQPALASKALQFATLTITVLVSFASAFALAHYLRWGVEPLVRTVTFVLLLLGARRLLPIPVNYKPVSHSKLTYKEITCLLVFSLFLSLSIIFGYHIVVSDGYSGTMNDNYISSYSVIDVIAFCLILYATSILTFWAFNAIKKHAVPGNDAEREGRSNLKPLGKIWVFALTAITFILFAPYLLAWWPGFIFGDSLNSITQAIGWSPWNNHHPPLYTMFIKVCIWVAQHLGFGITTGCALYSIVQMASLAFCFGYMSRWIVVRTRISNMWGIAMAVFFGASPYYATYSIAMWKDPLFSAALVLLTLSLFDFALSKGKVVKESKSWLVAFSIMMILMMLLRSNGVFIAGIILAALVLLSRPFSNKNRKECAKALFVSGATVILCLLITGPLYSALGVVSEFTAEAAGIPANQMARVVATEGDMSESDAAYMNEILPLDMYKETYRPCCVDLLKWDKNFDASVMSRGGVAHWISMGIRNPLTYFEAWELQTFGYWAINQPLTNEADWNISGGVPRNDYSQPTTLITFRNVFGIEQARELFPKDEWSFPASILNWMVLYVAICLCLLRRSRWTLSLAPTFGLALTLLIASPIYYWPRYEAAVYFLIPFYIAIFAMSLKGDNRKNTIWL